LKNSELNDISPDGKAMYFVLSPIDEMLLSEMGR
jgi:hypothetical protein